MSSLVSFSIILWTISAAFTIPGTDVVIPGLLFWVALIYAGVGTLITHLIGRALVPLNFDAAALRGGLPLLAGPPARICRAGRAARGRDGRAPASSWAASAR